MNFDDVINRKGTYSTQWDYIEDRFGEGTKDNVPYSISDTDFRCPEEIIKALHKRIDHGIFGYSRWNHSDYKGAIKNWYKKRYDTFIEEDWVIYVPNVIYTISILLEHILGDDKRIITHTPRYDGFSKILSSYDVFDIPLRQIEDKFITNFIKIEEGFKNGIKVFLLCNPENPVGKVWTKEELSTLIDLCKKYQVTLISDDIHMDIARTEVTPVLKIDTENIVIVSSPTKTFNTPSLGGAYSIIPDIGLRNKIIKHIKENDSLNSPTILGVISTIVAYNQCDYWVDELNNYLFHNFKYVMNNLNNYKGLKVYIPEGTYLMWIDFKDTGISIENFNKGLIEIGGLAIMSGSTYGDPYKIRLNVGCPLSKVQFAVTNIIKTIDKLT